MYVCVHAEVYTCMSTVLCVCMHMRVELHTLYMYVCAHSVAMDDCLDNSDCSEYAVCVGLSGRLTCVCLEGFTGDGFVCEGGLSLCIFTQQKHTNNICI